MTAEKLKQFISDHNIEFTRYRRSENRANEVRIFFNACLLEDFSNMLTEEMFDDGPLPSSFQGETISIDMAEICQYHGIEIDEIFTE